MTPQTIDKLAQGLSRKLVTLAQVNELVDVFVRQPDLTVDEALKRMQTHRPSEAELNKLIQKKVATHNHAKLRTDKTYRERTVPKIVGEILVAAGHSIDGKMIAERIRTLLEKEDS